MSNYRKRDFLLQHIDDTLQFYTDRALDPNGGFRQNYYDDGTTFDDASKHLVSSCRMVFNFCIGARLFDNPHYEQLWRHGARFLRESHWQAERRGYVWTMSESAIDETNHCYGLAFVVLACSALLERGDPQARRDLYSAWQIMQERFWQPAAGLYADDASADWRQVSAYRGQNANMHACEAGLFAFEASADRQFLNRSVEIAETITVRLAAKSDGLVWEHFTPDLEIDWDYNRDDPANLYRPWGFQPGHQTEWTKLLLLLYRHTREAWMLERAAELFDRATATAWDVDRGGLYYGFDPDGNICDDHKYFWVQAETMAAAALLARQTGKDAYWQWYERIWDYAWAHFVDHDHGAWLRVLSADNVRLDNRKSLAGAKCDYHNLSACVTALDCV